MQLIVSNAHQLKASFVMTHLNPLPNEFIISRYLSQLKKRTCMKLLTNLILGLCLAFNLYGQDDKIKELVSQGTELHDQGKYDEAIAKYKMALNIDKNSTLANYELSYTYMATKNYGDAIKYSKKVIDQDADNQQGAYIVLGSSLDMNGKPDNAIKVYEEGLSKFPNSNLLYFNLALTSYNQKDYDKAEKAAINAIIANPRHASSHVVLSAIMQAKGERVMSLLPAYYFLMLEPNSKRSAISYNNLLQQLGQGIERKNGSDINVNIPFSDSHGSLFGAAEMMVSLLAASRFTEENEGKSDMEYFVETNSGLFSVLGELKGDNGGFWWDLYVSKFYDLVQSDNVEAFSYYISQSSNSESVKQYIASNPDKVKQLKVWMDK
jgi:tetratricopeptide (TPR) repeat protein